jgi:quercetin dioxygenase-like cupin family protein
MTARSIQVIQPADTAKVVFGAGDEYRYLATGTSTDGGYFLVEAIVPPGGGPPPHVQTREEEAFYIFDGELTFYDNGEITAGPGTYLNIPKGAKHRFRNNSNSTAKVLFFFAPAGIEGLFDEFSQLDQTEAEPEAVLGALNAIGAKHGMQYFAD